MKDAVFIVLLLIVISHVSLLAEESKIDTTSEKSVITGVLLGALGFTNIPGSYGWGNFYAKDHVGFRILNIGGSACTVLGYASVFFLFAGSGQYEVWEVLAYTGFIGSYGFALASTIWGGLSVISYNDRVVTQKNQVGCQFALDQNSIAMEITYRY